MTRAGPVAADFGRSVLGTDDGVHVSDRVKSVGTVDPVGSGGHSVAGLPVAVGVGVADVGNAGSERSDIGEVEGKVTVGRKPAPAVRVLRPSVV